MIFIAHQQGHTVNNYVEPAGTGVGGVEARGYAHRRKRPYSTFVMRMVMLHG